MLVMAGKAFRCGELETVTELHGSLDLKIENHTGFVLSPESDCWYWEESPYPRR